MNNAIVAAATARAKAGLSLRQISDDTRITMSNLEAIESGEFSRLPGGIYATSYIRQYARAIDFDEFDLLAAYREATGAPPTLPALEKVHDPSVRGFRPLFQH